MSTHYMTTEESPLVRVPTGHERVQGVNIEQTASTATTYIGSGGRSRVRLPSDRLRCGAETLTLEQWRKQMAQVYG